MRAALAAALLAVAPFQCASKAAPERRMEDDAGQGLYDLANDFHAKGDEKSRTATLEFLVKRYPSSRFAEAARVDLGKR
jgi:outer membrane protein assembly factor BamD (BamD/ComL family)